MRISVFADLHYPVSLKDPKELDSQPWREADVLALAGDMVNNFNSDRLAAVLDYFSSFPGEKLFIAGNHEIWTTEGDPEEIYRKELKLLADAYGFHYLDDSPRILGNIGFVGNMGWYDYSLALKSFPLPDDLIILEEDNPEDPDGFRETNKRWENLGPEDYRKKRMGWKENGKTLLTVWNDRAYVKWPYRDEDFLDRCLSKTKGELDAVSKKAEKIVVINHHAPFAGFLREPQNLAKAFEMAFLGSRRLGELYLRYPKVKLCISGHIHHENELMAGPLKAVSVKKMSLYQTEI